MTAPDVIQRGAVSPLDHVPGLSASNGAPVGACPNCWRAWLVGSRNSIGYCWHGKVAWRVKSGALSVVPGVTREEHRAMVEYMSEMEAITCAAPSQLISAPR